MLNPQMLMQMMMQGKTNPQMLMQQFQGDPMMNMAMQMAKGKNPNQIKEVIHNIAKEKGLDINQVALMAQNFGIKL